MSEPFCDKCAHKVTHEGTPTGTIETVNGVKVYAAIPTGDYDKTKAVLFLPDVFGLELINAKLLADDFAKNGFQTYIPDYLNGDPLDPEKTTIQEWFKSHTSADIRPPLDKVIAGLKEQGITTFGATGYCLGARYVFDLAFDKVISVAVCSHPSLIEAPKDLEKFKESGVPLLINSCEFDQLYPAEKQKEGDRILGGGSTETDKYKRVYFEGCEHGFAVRGDLSKPEVKRGKELSFENAVHWFKLHL